MNAKQAFSTALLALAVAAGTAARASATDLWLHVKVHDGKEDSHVTVNLPLSMVEKASALIPADAHGTGKIKVSGGKEMSTAQLRELWQEVQKRPDATYVTVDEKDSKVRIAKRGDYLFINADDRKGSKGHENVELKIPVDVVSALLSGQGDEMNVSAAIQALAKRGEGELVTVNGDNETVRIWVDAASETR